MNTPLLIAASVIIPLFWGWGTHLLFAWIWPPQSARRVDHNDPQRPQGPPFDFQI